jgi:CRISPR-associated protein Cas2
MDAAKWRQVKAKLESLINKEKDSLRYYYLGNQYKGKIEHIGVKEGLDVNEALIL